MGTPGPPSTVLAICPPAPDALGAADLPVHSPSVLGPDAAAETHLVLVADVAAVACTPPYHPPFDEVTVEYIFRHLQH